jgi:exodeoxyribonuclease VII small subunit
MLKEEKEIVEPSYEEAMGRLEKIVGEMETSNLPLEELLVRYEEGIRLVALCNQRLAGAENRIETLSRQAAGKTETIAAPQPKGASKDLTTNQHEEIRLF